MADFAQKRPTLPAAPDAAGARAGGVAGPASAQLARLSAALNARPEVRQLAARGAALSRARPMQRPSQAASDRAGLPEGLKQGVEALSGLSLDGVRVHRDSSKPAELGALGYAQGDDIHLAPGQERHLPHEAWHVVQQRQGRVRPTLQTKGAAVNDDRGLEAEADRMGAEAARRRPDADDARDQGRLGSGRSPGRVVQRVLSQEQLAKSYQNAHTYRPALVKLHGEVAVKAVLNANDLIIPGHGSGGSGSAEHPETTKACNLLAQYLAAAKSTDDSSSSASAASSSGAKHSKAEAQTHAEEKEAAKKAKEKAKKEHFRLSSQGKI